MKKEIIGIISFILCLAACSDKKNPENKSADPAPAPHYVLAKVEKGGVSQEVKLPAQLAAYQEVSIFPKVNGYVTKVLVDIGSKVKQSQLLMVLEAPELLQATVQAKERWTRAKAEFSIAKENFQRLSEAAQTPGAISPLDISTAKARMEADSALSNAEKSNWQMQQTMMGYLTVTAPFSGVITQRNVHPGALVSAESKDAKPMLELKEIDHLRLEVDIPENLAATLRNDDSVSFILTAFPGIKRTGRISRKSMNISPQFRSERVEIDVFNRDSQLAPGMFANLLFDSKGNKNGLIVPKTAVVTSTEKKYVILDKEGKAHQVEVTTGNEQGGRIEVIGSLQPGDELITNANDEIKEGALIK